MKKKSAKRLDQKGSLDSLASFGRWSSCVIGRLPPHGPRGRMIFIGSQGSLKELLAAEKGHIVSWQLPKGKKAKSDALLLTGQDGPLVVVHQGGTTSRPLLKSAAVDQPSLYASARDIAGKALARLEEAPVMAGIQLDFIGETAEQRLGFLVGLQIASFQFTLAKGEGDKAKPVFYLADACRASLEEARRVALAINLARILVSLPANHLSPASYAAFIKESLPQKRGLTIRVFNKRALKREKMGLLLAVGEGSRHEPLLVHIRYRPASGQKEPVAFVGKGITFDTGGLDMKTSATMRSMKKDMAGSAALFGLAHYWVFAAMPKPFDIYLPLAENRIDGHSLCPGDVVTSRKGLAVEISNTDAEGRLLLADACHYAATRRGGDRPKLLIDVATLTGAAKIALGPDLMALFCNDEKLAETITKAAKSWGDPLWRLPLHAPYHKALKSPAADLQNCASSPLGGAITAALFVQRFTEGLPWAHLDIMAWAENLGGGGVITSGANGQAVQCLIGLAHVL